MRIRNKKLMAVVLTVCLVLTQMVFATSAFAADSKDRLAGADRYATAIAITQAGWTTSDYAVLARGDDEGGGADALGAAPLAAKYKAPILLTEPAALTDGVLQELKSLGVKNVFIAGGTGAVSAAVEKTLTDNGMAVTRFAGADRFETAYKIAVGEFKAATGVALVYAYNFADALSISSFAAANGMPILLASNDYVPEAEKAYIADKQIYVVGGNGVISDALFAGLKNATRYAGLSRYETNAAVLSKLTFNYDAVYVATGENFPDALAGAALAAAKGNPIVLFDPVNSQYAQVASDSVKANTKVVALGGISVVPQVVVDDLKAEVAKKVAAEKAAAIKAAVDAITALPAVDALKLTDKDAVVAAQAKVDEAKAKGAVDADITNLATLTALQAKLVDLQKAADDYAALLAGVETKVAAYEAATADLSTQALVDAANTAKAAAVLTGLNDTDKAAFQIRLDAADVKVADAQKALDTKAAADVDAQIVALPAADKLVLTDGDAVAAARTAYDALTEAQQALVTGLDVLTAAEAKIADLQDLAAVVDTNSFTTEQILPGIYLAKVNVAAGANTDGLKVYVDGVEMTLKTATTGSYFYAQVSSAAGAKLTVSRTTLENVGSVAFPDGKIEGVVENTTIDNILPGVNVAKVILKAGVDNVTAKINGVAMTLKTDVDGSKFFYAQTADAGVTADVYQTMTLSVDVALN